MNINIPDYGLKYASEFKSGKCFIKGSKLFMRVHTEDEDKYYYPYVQAVNLYNGNIEKINDNEMVFPVDAIVEVKQK